MQPIDATYNVTNRSLRIRQIQPMEIEIALDAGMWRKSYRLDEDRTDKDFARAVEVAVAVYGRRNRDKPLDAPLPNCTQSDLHEIWTAMREVAGC